MNITVSTVGVAEVDPTQKYLKETVMPHEPCLSERDRSKQEEQEHSFKVLIFIWGVLFRMLNVISFCFFVVQLQRIGSQLKESFTLSLVGGSLLFQSRRYGFQVMWDTQESIKISVSMKSQTLCFLYKNLFASTLMLSIILTV